MIQRVAVVDLNATSREQVVTISAVQLQAKAQEISSLTDIEKYYGDGSGPEIALLGLDNEPAEVLAIARAIIARSPTCSLIGYAMSPSAETMMQAMSIDVRRFLPFPFDGDALSTTVASLHRPSVVVPAAPPAALPAAQKAKPMLALPPAVLSAAKGNIIALYSAKGGVGTTTMAVNLACALRPSSVLLIDANISFGNLGMFLDTQTSRSMIDLAGDPADITAQGIASLILTHPASGLKMLLSPPKPEDADHITKAHLRAILELVRPSYDYIIVDTWPSYDDRVLAVLDGSDRIVMPIGPDYPALKNAGAFLRVADLLGYPREKIVPVLMRADTVKQEHIENAEKYLKRTLECRVVSDGVRVTESVNKGTPFVLTEPQSAVSRNVIDLARLIDGRNQDLDSAPVVIYQPFISVVKKIFSRVA